MKLNPFKKKTVDEQIEELEQKRKKAKAAKKKKKKQQETAIELDGDYVEVTARMPFKKARHKFLKKMKATRVLFVNMELLNGNHVTLLVSADSGGFTYRKNYHTIDESLKYYNLSLREWCLDYHEELTPPIERRVPVELIRKGVSRDAPKDALIYALNPSSVNEFMHNNVIKSAIRASSMAGILKKILAFAIISAIGVLIVAGLVLWSSGALEGVGL